MQWMDIAPSLPFPEINQARGTGADAAEALEAVRLALEAQHKGREREEK